MRKKVTGSARTEKAKSKQKQLIYDRERETLSEMNQDGKRHTNHEHFQPKPTIEERITDATRHQQSPDTKRDTHSFHPRKGNSARQRIRHGQL